MAVKPIQTYYVPLPQEDLFDSLSTISNDVSGAVKSGIGIAIAAPGTVIYYDHWEDGYEVDVTAPTQSTTEIWGDGNLANGAAPGDADDLFAGGDVVKLVNDVPIPRDPSDIFFDGGDHIQASFPIAVTTGSFAENPGSFLAGAVEVLDTGSWANSYTMPIGEDTGSATDAFEYTAVHVMAGTDNTTVTVDGPNGTTVTLNQGETVVVRVNQGNTVTSDKPVQAHLVTGDINSSYEMRWYSLTPRDAWSDEYYAPVAEEAGSTGFWLYNPDSSNTITVDYDSNNVTGGGNFSINPGETIFVEVGVDISVAGGYSGIHFFSDDVFFAFSQIDADGAGETFEWGTRLLTQQELSAEVLVGFGIGNSRTDPDEDSRSVVWVTPVANAFINIDFNGDGIVDDTVAADRLQSIRIIDDSGSFDNAEDDQDMSGARIFAVAGDGTPVDIAVAWGQNPSLSGNGDELALDLGTLVPPLPALTAAKSVSFAENGDVDGDGLFDPGDTIEYTITILNFTRTPVNAGGYDVVDFADPVFDNTTYVENSTKYTYATGRGPDNAFGTLDDITNTVAVPDEIGGSGTPFPLDDDSTQGFDSLDVISGYERQTLTFQVRIKDFGDLTGGVTEIVNEGALLVNDISIKDLEVTVPLDFDADIQLVKSTNGLDANVPPIPFIVQGGAVTWTYAVTNTGNVFLDNISLVDDHGTPGDASDDLTIAPGKIELDDDGDGDAYLEPGETWTYSATGTAGAPGLYTNVAVVIGDPVYSDGQSVAGLDSPTDSDLSRYFSFFGDPPSYLLTKTVTGVDVVGNGIADAAGDIIEYVVTLANTGPLNINNPIVSDPLFQETAGGTATGPVQTGGAGDNNDNVLDVGETWTYTGHYTLQQADLDSHGDSADGGTGQDGDIDNTATVEHAILPGQNASASVPLVYSPDFVLEKTVVDVGGNGPNAAVDNPGEVITYQIVATNTGNVSLTGAELDDPLLEGPNGTISAPVESINTNGVLEVGEVWTYTGTYTVPESVYYALGWKNNFESSFVKNVATFDTDQVGPESSETSTPLFSGVVICGTNRHDMITGGSTGDLAPTNSGDFILGGRGNDVIDGLGGNDWIDGGRGKDKLTGGDDDDRFVFATPITEVNVDKILDFGNGADKLVLDSAVFKKLVPGELTDEFSVGKAKDKDDYIIFNKANNTLLYDPNGSKSGDGKAFAKFKGDTPDIDAGDFFVI